MLCPRITLACLAAALLLAHPTRAAVEDPARPAELSDEGAATPPPAGDVAEEEPPPALPAVIEPTDWIVLPRVGDYRRAALHADPVEVRFAREPGYKPQAGDRVTAFDGREAAWRAPATTRRGDLAGGYAYAEFDSSAAGVMLLEAPGAAAVWLDGVWLPGDPYRQGWLRPPVEVVAGRNRMLVHLARPNAAPRFVKPTTPVAILADAATLPDLLAGSTGDLLPASAPIQNASSSALENARLRVAWGDGEPLVTPLRRIDPLLVTPVTFNLPPIETPTAGQLTLRVEVLPNEGDEPLAACELPVRVVAANATRRVTRVSPIDGSVQAYAAAPPRTKGDEPAGVVLLLHDAGQTAEEAIASFEPPPHAWVVAPNGRGRWGFDWEDWSREDALEALDHFLEQRNAADKPIDPNAVAVTGQGMGAHGALRLATLRPDRFSAVAATDPWLSFGAPQRLRSDVDRVRALREVLARQAEADDPLRTLENLSDLAVAVAHRGANGIEPTDARRLRAGLAKFHADFAYRETADAKSLARDHADWLARTNPTTDAPAERILFATPDVGVASTRGWVTLIAAERPGDLVRVDVRRDKASIRGTTTNAKRLTLDLGALPKPETGMFRVRLDGGETVRFRPGRGGETLDLIRGADGDWRRVPRNLAVARPFGPALKAPDRSGGFKSAFRHRPVLIYGTNGSEEERSWAAARARYDAHLFLYRGAGRLEVLPDTVASATLASNEGRNRSVILYGNSDTNAAFRLLLRDSSVRLKSGVATIGGRPESGEGLAVVTVRPRVASTDATVGVIGGAGVVGMRLTDRLRWFWAGAAYPDLLLFGPEALAPPKGRTAEDDVRAAGWFGYDWKVDDGVVWRDAAI